MRTESALCTPCAGVPPPLVGIYIALDKCWPLWTADGFNLAQAQAQKSCIIGNFERILRCMEAELLVIRKLL